MEATQNASLRLADATGASLVALHERLERGEIDRAQFQALGAAIVARANAGGVALADIGVAAEVLRQLGTPRAPLALPPTAVQVNQERIGRDLLSTLDAGDVPAAVRQVGRSEVLVTVAATVQTAMVRQGAAGWVRQLDMDPCPVCVGLADGVVRSPSVRMARHIGCGCIQVPTFR